MSLGENISQGTKALVIAVSIIGGGSYLDKIQGTLSDGSGDPVIGDTNGINMPENCVTTTDNTTLQETSGPSNKTSGFQGKGDLGVCKDDRTLDNTPRSTGTTPGNQEKTNNIVYENPKEGRDYQIQNNKLVIYGPKDKINIRFEDLLRSIPSDNNITIVEVEGWGLDLDDIITFKAKYPTLETVITSRYYSLSQDTAIMQYCKKNNITITSPVAVAMNDTQGLTPLQKEERLQKQIAAILGFDAKNLLRSNTSKSLYKNKQVYSFRIPYNNKSQKGFRATQSSRRLA